DSRSPRRRSRRSPSLAPCPRDLLGLFVGAQSEERGLAQLPVGSPLRVRDLRDELGLHPRRVAHARRGIERRLLAPQLSQLRAEVAQRLMRVAGAHLSGVAKTHAIEHTDEERAELRARALRRRVAPDDELGLAPHLHLAPRCRALARAIARRSPFRHQPLPYLTPAH